MGKREFVLGALCLLAVALLSGSVREAPETAQADAPAVSSEPWMRERIYRKLNAKLSAFPPMNLQ